MTRSDRLIKKLKDNKYIAGLVVIGIVVSAIASFTDAIDRSQRVVRMLLAGPATPHLVVEGYDAGHDSILFTLTNPPESSGITISNISALPYRFSATFSKSAEQRYSIDVDVSMPKSRAPFFSSNTISVKSGESASFTTRFGGAEGIDEEWFVLQVTYIDDASGRLKNLISPMAFHYRHDDISFTDRKEYEAQAVLDLSGWIQGERKSAASDPVSDRREERLEALRELETELKSLRTGSYF